MEANEDAGSGVALDAGGGLPWHPTDAQSAMLSRLMAVAALQDPPVAELVELVASELAHLFQDTCIASLLSDDGEWLHPLGLADPDSEVCMTLEGLVGVRARADRGYPGSAVKTLQSIRLPTTTPEVMMVGRPELASYAQRHGVCSAMLAPMRARGRAIGHATMLRRRGDAPYSEPDEAFLQYVADWTAMALSSTAPASVPRPVGPREETSADISGREREILTQLALGHTNREIAEQLVLSVRTVEWHRSRIQWKLGVRGRAELARLAREYGLID
jgi:DNA-binding NarL/FixJ family response regulator